MQGMGGAAPQPGAEVPQNDTGEQIYISSLSLLKMLKHCRAGVPFEVMGLMVGEIHDDYTITVVDVFTDQVDPPRSYGDQGALNSEVGCQLLLRP